MKVGIVGSRGFRNYDFLKKTMLKYYRVSNSRADTHATESHIGNDIKVDTDELEEKKPLITAIVSGGAEGADKMGERFADEFGLEKIIHLPKSGGQGNKRFADRNRLIIRDSEELVAFWDGHSPGTFMTITFADEANVSCLVVHYITEKIELNPLKKQKKNQEEKEQQKSSNEEKRFVLAQSQQRSSSGNMSFYDSQFYKKAIENTKNSKVVEKNNDSLSDNSINSATEEEKKSKEGNEKVITTSLLELKPIKSSKISSISKQSNNTAEKEANTAKRKFSIFDDNDPFTNANKNTKKLKQAVFKNVLTFTTKKTSGPIKKSIQTHLK